MLDYAIVEINPQIDFCKILLTDGNENKSNFYGTINPNILATSQ